MISTPDGEKKSLATLDTNMGETLFTRYTTDQCERFMNWLTTPQGREVYRLFVRYANEWRDSGNTKCQTYAILNRVRWQMSTQVRWQGFKVNNDYMPLLARQLVLDDPSFDGFFTFHSK